MSSKTCSHAGCSFGPHPSFFRPTFRKCAAKGILILSLAFLGPPALAQGWLSRFLEPTPPSPSIPAVVRIVARENSGMSLGSGTLIDVNGKHGLVLTNWHVVRDATQGVQVQFPDGFVSPGHIHKWDKDWDLAAIAIYRPPVSPIVVSQAIPKPGDPLTIAGFGSGDFRSATGVCRQYLAPSPDLSYEIIEVARAAARQGDSGGPILNSRGELAGVLFGQGGGSTCGSHCGRVNEFLKDVLPRIGPSAPELAAAPSSFPSTEWKLSSLERSQGGSAPTNVAAGLAPLQRLEKGAQLPSSLPPESDLPSDPFASEGGATQLPSTDNLFASPQVSPSETKSDTFARSTNSGAAQDLQVREVPKGIDSALETPVGSASIPPLSPAREPLPLALESVAHPGSARAERPAPPAAANDWLEAYGLRTAVVFGLLVAGRLLLGMVR